MKLLAFTIFIALLPLYSYAGYADTRARLLEDQRSNFINLLRSGKLYGQRDLCLRLVNDFNSAKWEAIEIAREHREDPWRIEAIADLVPGACS